MRVIRGIINLNSSRQSYVVTIGGFDGVHVGHQEILKRVVAKAHALGLPALVITFEPHPKEYFARLKSLGDSTPSNSSPGGISVASQRLMTMREKITALANCGIDAMLCLRFDARLAALPAQEFVRQILLDKLHVKALFVGEDFGFGKGRDGDIAMLQSLAHAHKFELAIVPEVLCEGKRVSSTLIRDTLLAGNIDLAERFLGRPYSVMGHVAHGAGRGRDLDFPTANIELKTKIIPCPGVYAVAVFGIADAQKPLNGIANVGFRPTVGDNKKLLEFYLFDFKADIYGKLVRVDFLQRVRDEIKFANFDLLRQQIALDVRKVREFFER